MRLLRFGIVAAALAFGAAAVSPRAAQQACVSGPALTPEQKARRSQLIGLARDVNNQQLRAMNASSSYQPLASLPLTRPVPEGIEIKLAAEPTTYAFSIVDTTDACRSGVFSNETGLIYTGQALQ